jgi:hypothetical protein
MTAFRIAGFSGLVPRLAKQLLAPTQAQVATNCRLTSGDLRPRDGLLPVYVPVIERDIVSMFRMEKEGNGKWLAWDKDVDVARSPIAGNASRRFYYTGDGEPRVSDYDTATAGAGPYPSGCYVLGVTPPRSAPAVLPAGASAESGTSGTTGTGTTGTATTRSYVYTFVTQWGEESKPSPPSSVTTGNDDGAWVLSAMDDAPPNSGVLMDVARDTPTVSQVEVTLDTVFGLRVGEEIRFASVAGMIDLNARFRIVKVDTAARKIVVALATRQAYSGGGTWVRVAPHNTSGMRKRIYRTMTASSDTEYHYVATIPAATSTFNDTVPDTDVALAEVLPSATWEMPPANMKGIIILANGVAAGFAGNEILFSEPFKPYAWPVAYRQTYDQDIVAIAVNGTTLVGMTTGNPFTITGVEPATMGGGMEKLGVAWPCMAKRGVANFAFGVGYPAPQGMVIIGTAAGTSDIVTKDLFTQSEWSELNPDTFIAAAADNRYYAGYSADGSSLMFVIDKAENASFLKVNQKITAIWADPATGKLYVAADRKIYEWEGDAGTKLIYEWRSRKFITAPPLNYGAARIDADFEMSEAELAFAQSSHETAVAANHALAVSGAMDDGLADASVGEHEIGGDAMRPIPPLRLDSLQFQLWIDGALKFSKQIGSSRAFRLPGGYKADNVEIVLSGNVKVSAVTLAETMDGLRQA